VRQRKQDHAKTPDVDLVWVGLFRSTIVDLWCEIGLRACVRDRSLFRGHVIRKAKVHDLAPIFFIEQYVFQLQIPMDYLFRMDVVNGADDLLEEGP
jgi:hypothetical protein